MKTLLFDPYLGTLGGGEQYMLRLADVAAELSEVDVGAPQVPSATGLAERGFGTAAIRFVEMTPRTYRRRSADYDVAVRLTNHVPGDTRARRSILVIQFPFRAPVWAHPVRELRKHQLLSRYEPVVYSAYVADWCDRRWGIHPSVLAPGVDGIGPVTDPKQPLILAVGRFFSGGHEKRQDVLIEAYRSLPERVRRTWRLVLAGGSQDPTAGAVLGRLRKLASGCDVVFEPDAPRQRLVGLYRQASVFWHAAGFGRPADHPERAEHFGITTVEAMSARAVPLVYDDGGSREVVSEREGIRWRTVDDLVGQTVGLIDDPARLGSMGVAAERAALRYTPTAFRAAALTLLTTPSATSIPAPARVDRHR